MQCVGLETDRSSDLVICLWEVTAMKRSTVFRTTVSAALCLTLTTGAVMPKQALAWDWLSAGLALFQVGAE